MNDESTINDFNEKSFDLNDAMDKYGNTILRLCYLYLKDIQLAEDAFQDTFLNAYRGYRKFKGNCSEKTWITRIAINVCKSYLRKNWFKKVDLKDTPIDIPIEDNYALRQQKSDIIHEIMELSPKFKEVILLYYYEELKISEISEILKIPMGTVSTRLKRARQSLKGKLEGWGEEK